MDIIILLILIIFTSGRIFSAQGGKIQYERERKQFEQSVIDKQKFVEKYAAKFPVCAPKDLVASVTKELEEVLGFPPKKDLVATAYQAKMGKVPREYLEHGMYLVLPSKKEFWQYSAFKRFIIWYNKTLVENGMEEEIIATHLSDFRSNGFRGCKKCSPEEMSGAMFCYWPSCVPKLDTYYVTPVFFHYRKYDF